MIRIELSDDDLSRTRLAISPLWEMVASMFLVTQENPPVEYLPWVTRARRALQAIEPGPIDLSAPIGPYIPDFLSPMPAGPVCDVAAEIERVRATEPDRVRADLDDGWADGPPPAWEPFAARPRETLDRMCDWLHVYWDATLADDWPRLRAVLEGEMLGRARSLALAGPAAVLDELHPNVRWRPPAIEILKPRKTHSLELASRPLVLVPLVFAATVLLAHQPAEGAIGLAYQARGVAALWEPHDGGADGRLELLLGHGRAAVLRALGRPATTTELAARLGYAPSTVSAHLTVLTEAGVVERHRVRRSVFYGLNATGNALVALLGDDVPAALSA
jgi:DNA-binding transcriptional ArsR family regulator